jgi:hypothetical protein
MSNSQGIRRLSPFLIIAAFFLYKLTHLGISFFWDESWVYAPAIQAMAEIGPSLLPDAISLDYSRGHPLLFHFLGGLWLKMFGHSWFSMHFFALVISVAFLLFANQVLQRLGDNIFASIVLLLICVQPLFVAQASMVLPEMLLATLSLACVLFYMRGNTVLYIVFGILTVLTKETGILVLVSIVLYDFIRNIIEKRSPLELVKRGFVLCLPLLTLVVHMLYLKSVFGWYLYPEHTGMIKKDLFAIASNFFQVIHDQIAFQGRFLISAPFVVLYLYTLLSSKKFRDILLAILAVLVAIFTLKFYGIHFPLGVLYVVFCIHFCLNQISRQKSNKGNYLLLLLLFILIYALFSAANFYTIRYLLSTLLFTLIIPLYFLINELNWRKWVLVYLVATVPAYIYLLLNPESIRDINLSYLDYCPLQLEVVEYFEENELYDEQINTMFLMSVALKDDKAGYRGTELPFKYVNQENNGDVDYFIFYNVENDNRREGLDGEMIQRYESGKVWFEIWKTKTK